MVAAEPVLEIDPMLRLGELVLVDDDEDVIVRHIALRRLRLVKAFAARDRSVENDLQDPPRLATAAGELVRVFELFEKPTTDLLAFPLILRGERGYGGAHNASNILRFRA